MQNDVLRIAAGLALVLMAACATEPDTRAGPVADFIAVAELEELSKARMRQQFSLKKVTDRYATLEAHKDYFLVEFRHRCRALDGGGITPDMRREKNVLRPGVDTIRGCRIGRIFAIDETQAQELEQLGIASGN